MAGGRRGHWMEVEWVKVVQKKQAKFTAPQVAFPRTVGAVKDRRPQTVATTATGVGCMCGRFSMCTLQTVAMPPQIESIVSKRSIAARGPCQTLGGAVNFLTFYYSNFHKVVVIKS